MLQSSWLTYFCELLHSHIHPFALKLCHFATCLVLSRPHSFVHKSLFWLALRWETFFPPNRYRTLLAFNSYCSINALHEESKTNQVVVIFTFYFLGLYSAETKCKILWYWRVIESSCKALKGDKFSFVVS